MKESCLSSDWYAARVRSNQEYLVAALLEAKGLESYIPSRRTRRQWSDRMKESDQPLFPGYVFCRYSEQDRVRVQTTAGVVQIVGVGRRPVAIDEAEMDAVRRLVACGVDRKPCPYLTVGDRVEVCGGPLNGISGIIERLGNGCNLIVSISLLQRSVAVQLPEHWLVVDARKSSLRLPGVSALEAGRVPAL